jgi:hypothetical protein
MGAQFMADTVGRKFGRINERDFDPVKALLANPR